MPEFVVENILISKIIVGERRREKIGSLASLKSSLDRLGQIHPITVRLNGKGFELVAGERRMRAATALGWKKIRARIGNFDDDTLREIELDENAARLDLAEYEASKEKLRQIQAAEREVAEEKLSQGETVSSKGGRGKTGGVREAARRTGLDKEEIRRTKRHVATAEEHPVFQGPDWKRSQVLQASEALEEIPKRDQTIAVEMVAEPGVDPKSAVKMLENIASKPAGERREIIGLYRSGDPEKRSLAKTRAAKLPPMPDPRYTATTEMLRSAKACVRMKPDDLTAAYENLVDELQAIVGELDELYEKAKGH